jgi:hypothetical protein
MKNHLWGVRGGMIVQHPSGVFGSKPDFGIHVEDTYILVLPSHLLWRCFLARNVVRWIGMKTLR